MSKPLIAFWKDGLFPQLCPFYERAIARGEIQPAGTLEAHEHQLSCWDVSGKAQSNLAFQYVAVGAQYRFFSFQQPLIAFGIPADHIMDGCVFTVPEIDVSRFLAEGVAYGKLSTGISVPFNTRAILSVSQVVASKDVVLKIGRLSYIGGCHIEGHGSIDIHGNLKLWNDAIARFQQIILWPDGAPDFRPELGPEHPQPSIIFVPAQESYEIDSFLDGSIMTLADAPWPGLTPDLLSVMLVVATQCKGSVLIHQKMFESRLFFVDRLIDMGAQIILCDPHRAVVIGHDHRISLKASRLVSPDIRAGIAMLLAAMSARGTSTIDNIEQIDRGYEDIEGRLNALGARITRA